MASSSDFPGRSQPGQSKATATATGFFLPRSIITRRESVTEHVLEWKRVFGRPSF